MPGVLNVRVARQPVAFVHRPLRTRLITAVAGFGLLAAVVCLLAPLAGSSSISLTRAFDRSIPFADNVDAQIFFIARLPRVLAAALIGATLAAAGVVFQALLRNPLADPYTLGISAGASAGAMLAIITGTTVALIPPVPVMSLVGAALGAVIVYRLATLRRSPLSTSVLLLAGVTLNSFFGAAVMGLQYIADFTQIARAARWLMGDLDVGSFRPIVATLPLIVPAALLFAVLPASLNLLSLGSDAAASRGVDVQRAQRLAFLGAALATAGAVSLAGPVGFVGIIVPHVVRLLVGGDHRVLLPAAALAGAAFLVSCDLIARTAIATVQLPVGIITAVIGGPFFLWLLVRKG
jgi:iron complex transport system permease protein